MCSDYTGWARGRREPFFHYPKPRKVWTRSYFKLKKKYNATYASLPVSLTSVVISKNRKKRINFFLFYFFKNSINNQSIFSENRMKILIFIPSKLKSMA